MKTIFDRAVFVGCGLIGSSLARIAKQNGSIRHLTVIERADVVARIQVLGLADQVTTEYTAAKEADLVMLCTPLSAYREIGLAIASNLKAGAIVSDVGSVKGAVIDSLTPLMPLHVHFIPGHPIAGTENSGPESGFAELFQDRACLLTPLENKDADYAAAAEKLKLFWEKCGSRVSTMPADHHDKVLAMTSHLPHLIAYSIVDTCVKLEGSMQQEVIAYSASGFRDFTRIAASDPTMWRDVFLNNKEAVLDGLQRFIEDLMELQKAIRWDDGKKLFDVFSHTRAVRRSIIDQRQHIPEENKKKS
jgi:cyclohexadieny/prephenate dehydrogenase